MSASDHLGGQFETVHRGVFLGATGTAKVDALADRIEANPAAALRAATKNARFSSGQVRADKGAAGIHWSSEQDVAHTFARGHWRDDHLGVTIHAEPHAGSVLQPGSDEHTRMVQNTAILAPHLSDESEVTMRPGSSMTVTGLTVHRNGASTYHPITKDVRA